MVVNRRKDFSFLRPCRLWTELGTGVGGVWFGEFDQKPKRRQVREGFWGGQAEGETVVEECVGESIEFIVDAEDSPTGATLSISLIQA